jgi:hypothetical protein
MADEERKENENTYVPNALHCDPRPFIIIECLGSSKQ